VLLLIPLVSIVFGTIYLYNAREFTELLLAQPVHRRQLFAGQYLGLALPLSAAFVAGLGGAVALHAREADAQLSTLFVVGVCGVALTFIFTAFSALIAARIDDKVKGIGVAIGLWLGSMAATALPNSRLRPFDDEIQHGKVLLIVDVPADQAQDISHVVKRQHPEADLRLEPTTAPL